MFLEALPYLPDGSGDFHIGFDLKTATSAILTHPNAHRRNRIVLIDGEQLADFMIDNGVGVSDYKTYTVRRLDNDYFEGA